MFDEGLGEGVSAAAAVTAPGAPAVVGRIGDEAGANGIELDVFDAGPEGGFAFEDGAFEAVGPEAAAALVSAVDVAGVALLEDGHELADVDHLLSGLLAEFGGADGVESHALGAVEGVVTVGGLLEAGRFGGCPDDDVNVVAHPAAADDLKEEVAVEFLDEFEAVFFVEIGEGVVAGGGAANAVGEVVVGSLSSDFEACGSHLGLLELGDGWAVLVEVSFVGWERQGYSAGYRLSPDSSILLRLSPDSAQKRLGSLIGKPIKVSCNWQYHQEVYNN